ncbi:DUF732 domain-containing protein [Streptomyces sp. NRRL F-5122]|uniref:DUF732 domain-containing protein n=1 Tax=Streptomyces sp. NRRL F-5122 TaxID=1609098 RepID=UPI00131D4B69|nr:DUF732 domain-containing protein [Streptomyces sp. NRRL F-5122]
MSRNAVVAGASLAVLVLSGCAAAGGADTPDTSTPSSRVEINSTVSTATTSSADSGTDDGAEVPGVSGPDGPHRRAYLQTLETADQRLTADPDEAVDNGRNGCLDILRHKPGPTQIGNMQRRFSTQVPDLNPAAAQTVLAAARAYICPDA